MSELEEIRKRAEKATLTDFRIASNEAAQDALDASHACNTKLAERLRKYCRLLFDSEAFCADIPALLAALDAKTAEVERLENTSAGHWHKIATDGSAKIVALETENANLKRQLADSQERERNLASQLAQEVGRDLRLVEYMSNDGHWQMLNGDGPESILTAFNTQEPHHG